MNTNRFLQGLLGLVSMLSVSVVCALPITGEIEFAGTFAPDNGETVSDLQRVRVTFTSGDFASLVSVGEMVDLSGVDLLDGSANWSIQGLSFTLLNSMLSDESDDMPIDLVGEGSLILAGDSADQTDFSYSFSETQFLPTTSLFSMRIETREPAIVSEPSVIGLMLVGLVGLLIGRRRIR